MIACCLRSSVSSCASQIEWCNLMSDEHLVLAARKKNMKKGNNNNNNNRKSYDLYDAGTQRIA